MQNLLHIWACVAVLIFSAITNAAGNDAGLLADTIERKQWAEVFRQIAKPVDVNSRQPDGMTPLHWATQHGRVDIIERLLDAGAEADPTNEYGVTPLAIACEAGNPKAVATLLNAGADANSELAGGQTMLMTAARTGNGDVVRLLTQHGARVNDKERKGQTALMWAAVEGHAAAMDALLDSGASVDATSSFGFNAMMFAAREGRIDAAKRLLQAGVDVNAVMMPQKPGGRAPRSRTSALMLAVESGHFELAMILVQHGADPNDQRSGYTPLHAVTWVRKTSRGDGIDGDPPPRGSGKLHSLQFVRMLVAAGANINSQLAKGPSGRAKLNHRGATPFLLASKTADLPLLKLLLELGADPSVTNGDGCTPLMAAAGIGVTAVGEEAGTESEVHETIAWLVDLGADVNARDENGETAMHGAAYRNYPETVEQLANLGARSEVWNQKNKYGWTPRMIASGKRPGSFKPSPETIAALDKALLSEQ